MKIGRRGFLKILGSAAVAAVAAPLITPATTAASAPLFVPSQLLDYGVPTQRLVTATQMPPDLTRGRMEMEFSQQGLATMPDARTTLSWKNTFTDAEAIGVITPIPMLLLQDEYSPPFWQQFGRQRVPAGTTLMVDRKTADRWVDRGVAVAGTSAPRDLQESSARRIAERIQRVEAESRRQYIMDNDDDDLFMPLLSERTVNAPLKLFSRPDPFPAMIERATAKARKNATTLDWWDES